MLSVATHYITGPSLWVIPITLTLQFILFGVFVYAGMLDAQYRRVPLRIWYPLLISVPIIAILSGGPHYLIAPAAFSVLALLLAKAHLIGGSDWIAISLAFFGLPVLTYYTAAMLGVTSGLYLILFQGVERKGAPLVSLVAISVLCAGLCAVFLG